MFNDDSSKALSNDSESLVMNTIDSEREFTLFIEEYGAYVYGFISRKVWDYQDVDDIYQTTLMEAYRSFKSFRGESHPKTWICGIAYTVFKNYLKKKCLYSNESSSDEIFPGGIDQNLHTHDAEGTDPAQLLDRHQKVHKLMDSYEGLPEEMRTTLDEVLFKGSSYQEAAEKLNIPIGTVRSRISRARCILKEEYRKP